jgi:hypothetical protein
MDGTESMLEFYSAPGPMTDGGALCGMLDALPRELPSLVKAVQGLMVHVFWAKRYGLELSKEREQEVNLRWVSRQLARLRELDPMPLDCPRSLEKKLVGNCRDFSTMVVAALRRRGVPARARAGFGTYFRADHFEDHWVVEYWDGSGGRWVMLDAQLDSLQREVLRIPFDTLDMPAGPFVTGGKAWQMCREGKADPARFGIFDMRGMEFIRGDLLRDFLALNKVEILPWDGWEPLFMGPHDSLSAERLSLFDRMAALTLSGDRAFPELRLLFQGTPSFHPPF